MTQSHVVSAGLLSGSQPVSSSLVAAGSEGKSDHPPGEGRPPESSAGAQLGESRMTALRERYRQRLLLLPGELKALVIDDQENLPRRVEALAHLIAGTSGSYGFVDVSDAAFMLETVAKSIETAGVSGSSTLESSIDRFLTALHNSIGA